MGLIVRLLEDENVYPANQIEIEGGSRCLSEFPFFIAGNYNRTDRKRILSQEVCDMRILILNGSPKEGRKYSDCAP